MRGLAAGLPDHARACHEQLLLAQDRLQAAGWSRQQVLNAPNALCVLRALSGPVVAGLIVQESYGPALALTAVAGATDWLDGFLARRWNQVSLAAGSMSSTGSVGPALELLTAAMATD